MELGGGVASTKTVTVNKIKRVGLKNNSGVDLKRKTGRSETNKLTEVPSGR